jgi:hypothetical protein
MDEDGTSSTMDANPVSTVLALPSSDQDSLSTLASEDEEMNDDSKSLHSRKSQNQKGVRIDDHYYFEDEEPQVIKKSSQNEYQEAWYISDSEQDEEDGEDEDHEIEMEDVSDDGFDGPYREEEGASEMADTASEMHIELSPEEEAKQYPPSPSLANLDTPSLKLGKKTPGSPTKSNTPPKSPAEPASRDTAPSRISGPPAGTLMNWTTTTHHPNGPV